MPRPGGPVNATSRPYTSLVDVPESRRYGGIVAGGAFEPRPDVLESLARSPVVALVAPAGYGKTSAAVHCAETRPARLARVAGNRAPLLAEARRALRVAGVRRAPLDDTDDPAVAGREIARTLLDHREVLLLVDDLHSALDRDSAELLAELARVLMERAAGTPARAMLAGRSLPAGLTRPGLQVLGPGELRLHTRQVATLASALIHPAPDPVTLECIMRHTGGVPALVQLALRRPGVAGGGDEFAAYAERLLDGRSDPDAALVAVAAHLPWISPEIAAAVAGAAAWEALLDLDLPMVDTGGRWVLAGGLRDALRARTDPPPELLARATTALVRVGDVEAAVEVHLAAGDADGAAGVVAELSGPALEALDPALMRALLAGIGDAAARRPRALLSHARLLEVTVQTAERSEVLAEARHRAEDADDECLLRELDAEVARDLARDGQSDDAEGLARAVLRAIGPDELRTRARALSALGRALGFRRAPGDVTRSAEALREAAALCAHLGEPTWEAQTLLWLGFGTLYPEGHDDLAVATLRRAAETAPPGSRVGAVTATFLADVLLGTGRLREAEELIDEIERVGVAMADPRVLGYSAWNRAEAVTQRGEHAALAARLAAVERHWGPWSDHPTGAEFLAAGSEMAQRLDDEELSATYLRRAEERAAAVGHPEIAAAARAGHEARFGDPRRADELLTGAAGDAQIPRRDRWHLTALRAVAADRAGDLVHAEALAAAAVEDAAALGLDHLLRVREPAIADRVITLACRAGSPAAARLGDGGGPGAPQPRVEVQLFGGFRVRIAGSDRTPSGHPAVLAKLVVLAGGRITIDAAIDLMWPDADLDTGRRRLRNLLHRLRARTPDLLDRDGDTLRLHDAVRCDLLEVTGLLRDAAAGGTNALDAASAALAIASEPLLPEDAYAEWASDRRALLDHNLARAADRLTEAAARDGDPAAALAWLERAIELEPFELCRYPHAARLAVRAGDREHAHWLRARAARMHAKLDTDPEPDLPDVTRRG